MWLLFFSLCPNIPWPGKATAFALQMGEATDCPLSECHHAQGCWVGYAASHGLWIGSLIGQAEGCIQWSAVLGIRLPAGHSGRSSSKTGKVLYCLNSSRTAPESPGLALQAVGSDCSTLSQSATGLWPVLLASLGQRHLFPSGWGSLGSLSRHRETGREGQQNFSFEDLNLNQAHLHPSEVPDQSTCPLRFCRWTKSAGFSPWPQHVWSLCQDPCVGCCEALSSPSQSDSQLAGPLAFPLKYNGLKSE